MQVVGAGQARVSASYNALRAAGPQIAHEDLSRLMSFTPRSSQIAVAVRLAFERPHLHIDGMRPTRTGWAVVQD